MSAYNCRLNTLYSTFNATNWLNSWGMGWAMPPGGVCGAARVGWGQPDYPITPMRFIEGLVREHVIREVKVIEVSQVY
jgi:hypothetical protein